MRRLYLFWIIFFGLSLRIQAQESVFHVTTSSDSGPGSLREAITLANQIVGKNSILVEGQQRIVLVSGLPEVTNHLSILGRGMTAPELHFQGSNALVSLKSGSLVLSNLSLKNCSTTNAPLILSHQPLKAISCRFEDNFVTNSTGGVIQAEKELVLTNCLFVGNILVGHPGPDLASQPKDARGGPARGSALYFTKGKLRIDKCVFVSNRSIGGEPGMWSYGAYMPGSGGDSQGGATFIGAGSEATVTETSFQLNVAQGRDDGGAASGGAVHVEDAELTLSSCQFVVNKCVGGDQWSLSGDFLIRAGTATGGAVQSVFSDVSILHSVFENNSCEGGTGSDQPNSGAEAGGAIMVVGPAIALRECTFELNHSLFGSDIAGPILSFGGNAAQSTDATVGFIEADDVPGKPISIRTPKFEWAVTNGMRIKGIYPLDDRGAIIVGYDPDFRIKKINQFGSVLWNYSLRSEWDSKVLTIFQEETGNVVLLYRLFSGGTYRWSERDPKNIFEELPRQLSEATYVKGTLYTISALMPDGNGSNKVLAEKQGVGSFSLHLTNFYLNGPRQAVDSKGNWYITGKLRNPTLFPGSSVVIPQTFVLKISSKNELEWVYSPPNDYLGYKIFGLDEGVLIQGIKPLASVIIRLGSDGKLLLTKSFPDYDVDLRHVDWKRGLLYGFHQLPHQQAFSYTWDTFIVEYDSEGVPIGQARIFGNTALSSSALDQDGNLVLGGTQDYDFYFNLPDYVTFQNQFSFKSDRAIGFFAKLNPNLKGEPRLYARPQSNLLQLSWPIASRAILQSSDALASGAEWRNEAEPSAKPLYYEALRSMDGAGHFYRLIRPNDQ